MLSARTEDRKEKEGGSGGWRVKEGSESTLGGGSRSGVGRGSGRPGEAAPHRGRGRCRSLGEPRGSGQARRQESRVRMREERAELEQEEPGVTPVKEEGEDLHSLRFLKNHSCALWKTGSKWGRGRVNISEEATGKI